MKYTGRKMSLDTTLPTSVQSWLGHELEVRGIDAVIYTRYILSILQQENFEVEYGEAQFFPPNKKLNKDVKGRAKGKRCELKRKSGDLDSEEMKKTAAVECLLSVSDEDSGIEGLVDELYLKLKEQQAFKDVPRSPVEVPNGHSEGSDSVISTSPEDPAERYYAAFPALSEKLEKELAAAGIVSDSRDNVWTKKAQRVESDCDQADAELPTSQEYMRKETDGAVHKVQVELETDIAVATAVDDPKLDCAMCKDIQRAAGTNKNNCKKSGQDLSRHGGVDYEAKLVGGKSKPGEFSKSVPRNGKSVERTKGNSLSPHTGSAKGWSESKSKPAFIVPKLQGSAKVGSYMKQDGKFEYTVPRLSGRPNVIANQKSAPGGLSLHDIKYDFQSEEPQEDHTWYTEPLENLMRTSPVPSQRLYKRFSCPAGSNELRLNILGERLEKSMEDSVLFNSLLWSDKADKLELDPKLSKDPENEFQFPVSCQGGEQQDHNPNQSVEHLKQECSKLLKLLLVHEKVDNSPGGDAHRSVFKGEEAGNDSLITEKGIDSEAFERERKGNTSDSTEEIKSEETEGVTSQTQCMVAEIDTEANEKEMSSLNMFISSQLDNNSSALIGSRLLKMIFEHGGKDIDSVSKLEVCTCQREPCNDLSFLEGERNMDGTMDCGVYGELPSRKIDAEGRVGGDRENTLGEAEKQQTYSTVGAIDEVKLDAKDEKSDDLSHTTGQTQPGYGTEIKSETTFSPNHTLCKVQSDSTLVKEERAHEPFMMSGQVHCEIEIGRKKEEDNLLSPLYQIQPDTKLKIEGENAYDPFHSPPQNQLDSKFSVNDERPYDPFHRSNILPDIHIDTAEDDAYDPFHTPCQAQEEEPNVEYSLFKIQDSSLQNSHQDTQYGNFPVPLTAVSDVKENVTVQKESRLLKIIHQNDASDRSSSVGCIGDGSSRRSSFSLYPQAMPGDTSAQIWPAQSVSDETGLEGSSRLLRIINQDANGGDGQAYQGQTCGQGLSYFLDCSADQGEPEKPSCDLDVACADVGIEGNPCEALPYPKLEADEMDTCLPGGSRFLKMIHQGDQEFTGDVINEELRESLKRMDKSYSEENLFEVLPYPNSEADETNNMRQSGSRLLKLIKESASSDNLTADTFSDFVALEDIGYPDSTLCILESKAREYVSDGTDTSDGDYEERSSAEMIGSSLLRLMHEHDDAGLDSPKHTGDFISCEGIQDSKLAMSNTQLETQVGATEQANESDISFPGHIKDTWQNSLTLELKLDLDQLNSDEEDFETPRLCTCGGSDQDLLSHNHGIRHGDNSSNSSHHGHIPFPIYSTENEVLDDRPPAHFYIGHADTPHSASSEAGREVLDSSKDSSPEVTPRIDYFSQIATIWSAEDKHSQKKSSLDSDYKELLQNMQLFTCDRCQNNLLLNGSNCTHHNSGKPGVWSHVTETPPADVFSLASWQELHATDSTFDDDRPTDILSTICVHLSPRREGGSFHLWDVNMHKKPDFVEISRERSNTMEKIEKYLLNFQFGRETCNYDNLYIEGGVYGNTLAARESIWNSSQQSPGVGSLQLFNANSDIATDYKLWDSFMLQPAGSSMPRSISFDHVSSQVLRGTGANPASNASFEIFPSENSAFQDSIPPRMPHVQSEPSLSPTKLGTWESANCEKVCRFVQVKHLYKSEPHILQQLGLVPPEEFCPNEDSKNLVYSPETHFRPIQTPSDKAEHTPEVSNIDPLTQAQENAARASTAITFSLRDHTDNYQCYQGLETKGTEASFVPKFKVDKEREKAAQTCSCDNGRKGNVACAVCRPKRESESIPIPTDSIDYSESVKEVIEGVAVCSLTDSGGRQSLERLLCDVHQALQSCSEDEGDDGDNDESAHDGDSGVAHDCSSDYESMTQDMSLEDLGNTSIAELWGAEGETGATGGASGGQTYQNIWSCGKEGDIPSLPGSWTLRSGTLADATEIDLPEGGDEPWKFDDEGTLDDRGTLWEEHRDVWSCNQRQGQQQQSSSRSNKPDIMDDHIMWPWEDDVFDTSRESDSQVQTETSIPPHVQMLYSSDLEEQWLSSGRSFEVQVPRVHPRLRHGSHRKPCSFYMEGSCRRTDCKFAHDISKITCRFWEEGDCFKGITCPFLHGYASDSPHSEYEYGDKDFSLETEEFPELKKSSTKDGNPCEPSASRQSGRRPSSSKKQDRESSYHKGYMAYRRSTGRDLRDKPRTKTLPIDIKQKKK